MLVNVSILGNIWLCEALVNIENVTIQGVMGSTINEVRLSEYLPIRIKGNTTRLQYCANLLTDGFSGINTSNVSEHDVDKIINCKDQYKSVINIDQLLYIDKPDIISSIVLWSYIDTSVIKCNIKLYQNITILMHINSNTTESCSEKVGISITKDSLLLIYANCSHISKHAIQSVSIHISNWTGGEIVEIAVYSKFMFYKSNIGNLENSDNLFYFNLI